MMAFSRKAFSIWCLNRSPAYTLVPLWTSEEEYLLLNHVILAWNKPHHLAEGKGIGWKTFTISIPIRERWIASREPCESQEAVHAGAPPFPRNNSIISVSNCGMQLAQPVRMHFIPLVPCFSSLSLHGSTVHDFSMGNERGEPGGWHNYWLQRIFLRYCVSSLLPNPFYFSHWKVPYRHLFHFPTKTILTGWEL